VLQVRRPEQNTALNAKTEQFITAKISGNALKQGSRTDSVLRQSSSQLQNCKAAHSKSAAKHSQRYDGAAHKSKNCCANVSSNSSRTRKVCGWQGRTQGGGLEL